MKRILVFMIVGLLCSPFFSVFAPRARAIANPQLVGYWKFDEGSGSVAHDSSGYGNDGVLENGARWIAGVSGTAVSLDGIDGYVYVNSLGTLIAAPQVSCELWFRPSATLDDSHTSGISIIDKGDEYGFQINPNDGRIWFSVYLTPNLTWQGLATTTNQWLAGKWYQIAGTYNGSIQKVYVNGQLENNTALSGSLPAAGSYPLTIGCQSLSLNDFFNGSIDELKIYNSTLSASTISTDYRLACRVHNLDTGNGYANIQDALDANETLPGQRIQVDEGTYYENVKINKSLTLISYYKSNTILDGSGIDQVIKISADRVGISGFTITDGGGFCGIQIANCGDDVIENSILTNNSYGIELWNSSQNTITGNEIRDNVNGMGILYSDNSTITYNTIQNNSYGIWLGWSEENGINHNQFMSNSNQAYVEDTNPNRWDNGYPSGGNYWSDYNGTDSFHGSYQNASGSDGIGDTPYIIGTNNIDNYPFMNPYPFTNQTIYIGADGSINPRTPAISTIDNTTYILTDNIASEIEIQRDNIVLDGQGFTIQNASGNAGVYMYQRNNVTIQNLNINECKAGVVADSCTNIRVVSNNITDCGNGILFAYCQFCEIADNNLLGNGVGIFVTGTDSSSYPLSINFTIIGNSIGGSTAFGIQVDWSQNATICQNEITDSHVAGIEASDSWIGELVGNNIGGNQVGIEAGVAVWNITENNIVENQVGADVGDNAGEIYHNNFVCNAQQIGGGGVDVWDAGYPSGGNFWSDYDGADLRSGPLQNLPGSDGIGDWPYFIDANNIDHYPLMNPAVPINCAFLAFGSSSKSVVAQGSNLNATVTMDYFGDYQETFNFAIYANTTIATSQQIILSNKTIVTLTFAWNTAGFAYGNYTLIANAISTTNETTMINNPCTGGNVVVTILGDINGDFKVDMRDIALVVGAFGSSPSSSNWNTNADINSDGLVNMRDIALVARNFGQSYP